MNGTGSKSQSQNKKLIAVIAALVVVIIAGVVLFLWQQSEIEKAKAQTAQATQEVEQLKQENEQVKLENEQVQLSNEYLALEEQFNNLEIQSQAIDIPPTAIKDPKIKQKYDDTKKRIEQLKKELEEERKNGGKNLERIKELQAEIDTLKGVCRDLVLQIKALQIENDGLRADTTVLRKEKKELTKRVTQVTEENNVLHEKVTLAEKINVTAVTFSALNKKGKNEKKIEKAKQLKVTFTIPQNNTTPNGMKNIYLRITTPEGSLLGNAGTFSFEGGNVSCTARKQVEYGGEEITGETIYYDVNTTLTKGTYTVELFTDGYQLTSRKFNMTK